MFNRPHENRTLSIYKITQVSCGIGYFGIVTEEKELLIWGDNSYKQLGFQDVLVLPSPRVLNIPNVVQVSCGISHTGCITFEGDVYLWGKGKIGQLGMTYEDSVSPKRLEGIKASKISINGKSTLIMTQDGLLSLGEGKNGCLGIGVLGKSANPRKVKINGKTLSMSLGNAHCLAIVD